MDTTEPLNGTYFYGGLSNLTPQQLWWAITIAVVSEHLGISQWLMLHWLSQGNQFYLRGGNLVGQLQ
ncbi:hypothetical protein KHV55_002744 [Salmonella enterica]|nr:hypothetical protein [Salmonella enterica]